MDRRSAGKRPYPALTFGAIHADLEAFYAELAALMKKYEISVVEARLENLGRWIED